MMLYHYMLPLHVIRVQLESLAHLALLDSPVTKETRVMRELKESLDHLE